MPRRWKTDPSPGHHHERTSSSLTRKQDGANQRTDGTVTLSNGQQSAFWEEDSNQSSTGFDIQSSNGSGHGGCFANQICQMYKQGTDGHALSTTVVVDSADKIRLQETEYRQQQVVPYREATLARQP